MLKRVWRVLALISVTPLMTVVCLVALVWLLQGPKAHWLQFSEAWRPVETVLGTFPGDRWKQPIEPLGRGDQVGLQLIETEDGFRIADRIEDSFERVVLLIEIKGVVYRGPLLATHWSGAVFAKVIHPKNDLLDSSSRFHIKQKLGHSWRFRHFASAIGSRNYVPATGVIWTGYVANLGTVIAAGLLLRSFVWVWRGARMPWGQNESWGKAAFQPCRRWWATRMLLWSPWTTCICFLAIWTMAVHQSSPHLLTSLVRPLSYQEEMSADAAVRMQERLLRDKIQIGHSMRSDNWSPVVYRSHFTDEELRAFDAWKGEVVTGQPRFFSWWARMYDPAHAQMWFDPPASTPAQEVLLKSVVEKYDAVLNISPGISRRDWSVHPARIYWDGIVYNLLMLIALAMGVLSLRWLIDGVVWPWQARRLRQGACLRCGYSLAGLSAEKCPECGTLCATI